MELQWMVVECLIILSLMGGGENYNTGERLVKSTKKPEVGYTIHLIQDTDVEEVMDLLRRTFFIHEPLNQAIDLCPGGVGCPELEEYCRKDILSGFSLKAVDNNGKIVGVTLSTSAPLKQENNNNDLLSQAQRCQNPKFKKILYILASREEARLWAKYPDITTQLEITVAATDPDWRRRGIMNKLVQQTEYLAVERNISLLRIDTSSHYSALSAEKNGFTCVYKQLYTDIKHNGQPLIVPKPPHIDDRVYVKEIFAKKEMATLHTRMETELNST